MTDFKKELNPVQYKAVTHPDGPLLIVAGAGSGKTRVLTYRIAYLTTQGVQPSRILAVTFTNKAAGEMAKRVDKLVNAYVPVSTFHSFCLRVLRTENDRLPYANSFVVYDKSDQLTLIKDCMRRLNVSDKHTKPKMFANEFNHAKNKLITAAKFAEKIDDYKKEVVANVYKEYEAALLKANAMDFDDLIMQCVLLLQQNEDILKKYQNKFDHMLIDEFQDTNFAQYTLAKLLAKKHKNICVVGDPDQSIYKFRGADIKNILDFEHDFKNSKLITLEQNYRSTATVLNVANDIISNNTNRKEKKLWTENEEGAQICIYKAIDEHDEAEFVIDHIREQMREDPDLSLNDIVIFHRIHALTRVFEDHFRRERMSHIIIGDVGFYNRREIRDIVAYLRVIANQADDVNFKRIINTPHRGIGSTTQETIARYARSCNITLFEAADQAESISNLSKAAQRKIVKFMQLMNTFCKAKNKLTTTELVQKVIDEINYIEKVCSSNDLQDKTRVENIKELISAAAEYDNTSPDEKPSVEGFLHEVALTSDIDNWNDSEEAVTLMTIHNAKGLEFPVVYIVGMEENLFPHYNSSDDPTDIEEERRLCYVGMTRAKKRLSLSCAYHRTVFGQRKVREPSRFLGEIPDEFIEVRISEHRDSFGAEEVPPVPKSKKSKAGKNGYTVGNRIIHSHFGDGEIESITGSGDSARLTIQFDSLPNPKVLVAQYAKLRVLK